MLPPKVILATTDFSDASRLGLVAALGVARGTGATLHVLNVEEPLLAAAARHAGLDSHDQAVNELKALVQGLDAGDLSPQIHVATGNPVSVILDTATTIGADMIVIGSHGRSGISRVMFGSTAEGVLREARIPVLVIPAKEPS
jgi:nucleotide-binding universal stress UspA family protein